MNYIEKAKETHRIWHKFQNWLTKTYGKDLYEEWEFYERKTTSKDGRKYVKKLWYRSFNDLELSRKLVGYEVMEKVKKYIKRYCPEIIELSVDDKVYAESTLLLIPHPKHGITVLYIPQCTAIQNSFFLYDCHFTQLIKGLKKLKSTYKL